MAKRRTGKKRTCPRKPIDEGTPVSMIIRKGKVSKAVKQLVTDLRKVMMPLTTNKVKEQNSNVLEDFISVARPLGISHIFALSQKNQRIYLALGKMPHGATLTFQVLKYSLESDVKISQKEAARHNAADYQLSPLLALNGFRPREDRKGEVDPRAVELMRQTFVSLFPTIDVREVRMDNATKRVVLFYHSSPGVVEMRHYAIARDVAGSSKTISDLYKQSLSRRKDLQAEEVEHLSQLISQVKEVKEEVVSSDEEEPTNVINIKSSVLSKKARIPEVEEKRILEATDMDMALTLKELGPRITMKLVNVQTEAFRGDVIYRAPDAHVSHFKDVEDVEQVPYKKDNDKEDEDDDKETVGESKEKSEPESETDEGDDDSDMSD